MGLIRDHLLAWELWLALGIFTVLAPQMFGPIALLLFIILVAYGLVYGTVQLLAAIGKTIGDVLESIGGATDHLVKMGTRQSRAVAPPPEPWREPTDEEVAAEAMQRYEKRLRLLAAARLDEIELQAAQMKAKQRYLHDINQAIG